ncbi:hypothetical protein [Sphingomonas sp.]|uniref:hypothetical protein n=1 Tax=Sphingomonas sp. TaxID=28214 RepID=UPI003CC5EF57
MAEQQDGVENAPGKTAGGESEGGAYPNPHTGHGKDQGGFMGHGGQSQIDYSGTGEDDAAVGNVNAVTGKS